MLLRSCTITLLLALLAAIPAQAGTCKVQSPKRITRPYFPGAQESPTFDYAFSFKPAIDPGLPTVIFLPGGPGLGSIGSVNPKVPAGYGIVQTDPRGIGCNAPPEGTTFPDDFYSTENLASDVVAIVKELGLENYIIYGQSYGTLLGTVSVSQIEAAKLPRPKALILEGTIGRAFKPAEAAHGFQMQWVSTLWRLTPSTSLLFRLNPAPLGFDARVWGRFFETFALYGNMPGSGNYAHGYMSLADPLLERSKREPLLAQLQALSSGPALDYDGDRLYRRIACREIADDFGPENNFIMLLGSLIQVSQTYCGSLKLDRPFDSARYQLETPIVYFQGTLDPATPFSQARYHFDNQKRARRTFVTIDGGGHIPLALNLSKCQESVWSSMTTGNFDSAKVTTACGLRVFTETRLQP